MSLGHVQVCRILFMWFSGCLCKWCRWLSRVLGCQTLPLIPCFAWLFYLQIFDLFDVKRKGMIDFGDFVRSLNVFHPNASKEAKINCKFRRFTSLLNAVQYVMQVYSLFDLVWKCSYVYPLWYGWHRIYWAAWGKWLQLLNSKMFL